MARPLPLLLPLAIACATTIAAAGCGRAPASRPNLVLVSVDTLRPDRLACYGGAADVGTAICALAADGTRWTWAFSAAPSTAPSVASFLTSRLPRDHGVTELASSRLADGVPTLAERLAAAGYATGAFVANPVLSHGRGFERGFSVYDDRMVQREGNRPLLEREAKEITDAALAWVRVARPPWFLWIHYQDPHGPYEPPDTALAQDPPGAPGLPVLADQSGFGGIPAYQAIDAARAPATYEARYDSEIRWLDRQLSRLVAGLDARGRPALVLTADHGEAFGEDGFWFAHGHSLGIDQIRVPLLYRPATPRAPRVVSAPASTLDVSPTLLAAAGLPPLAGASGRPLDARADPARPAAPLFAEHRLRIAVVLGDRYYARDRRPLDGPVPEPVTGGTVPPLPPRVAALASDGRFRGYEEVAPAAAPLEPLVAAFLAHAPPVATASRRLDPQTRQALQALGYLE